MIYKQHSLKSTSDSEENAVIRFVFKNNLL